jgi:penicillin-binding protein 1A
LVSIAGRIVLFLVLLALVLVLWGLTNVYQAYAMVRDNMEGIVDIDIPRGGQATRIYARDYDGTNGTGTLLSTVYDDSSNRRLVAYQDIPPMLLACTLSTEDHRFFDHGGVDFLGTMRAVARGLRRGGDIRGTSTITQQLSRNVFLPYIKTEKTLNRKVQEVIIAGALEKRFTKYELLEAYLNHIYYGAGAHGVAMAARTYFDKDLDDLTLAECAMLAGLPQTPSKHNPMINPENGLARRNDVLHLLDSRIGTDFFNELIEEDPEMFGDLEITHADVQEALTEEVRLASPVETNRILAPYFTTYVRDHVLYQNYDVGQVLRQGLVVQTTIDPLYQQWAEEIVADGIDKYREQKRVSQGALILLEAKTGEVLACVGGYRWMSPNKDGDPDMLNRALQSSRPVGSSFKPFTYSTAYEQGFPVTLTIWDGPNRELSAKQNKEWPQNSDKTYLGWISIFYARQRSRNAPSVDLLVNCTGIEPVIETARKMGITARLDPVPSLTLGVCDIKPVEMAEAFDTFVNMGMHVDSIVVKKVYNQSGILLELNDTEDSVRQRSNRALSENTAWMMVQNMRRVVEAGTGTRARVKGVQIAGKTGTNDDFADAWFVGYSPELVCAVWVGNDDYQLEMNRMFGGDLPAEIFKELMTRVYTRQVDTAGDGDEAVEIVRYEPRYTQTEFEKPPGASFNGFPAPQAGQKLERDEEGNLVIAPPEPEEGEDPGEGDESRDPRDDDGFYNPWDPPPSGHVFF